MAAPPAGFDDTLIADVSAPMDVAWTPDGRMLIPSKHGQLRVYQDGALLPTPALDLSSVVCTNGERGLVGIDVHPNFAANHFVYLYYTYNRGTTLCTEGDADPSNAPVNRLSRFVLSDVNVIDPASEVVLFQTVPMHKDHHTGGDVKFGKDGLLYVTVGDSGAQSLGWPQNLGILAGKLVRIADDGSIPAGNPYTGAGTARCNLTGMPPAGSAPGTVCQEIYSYGFRNPFRMAMDPNAAGVRFYINDVGQHTWEDISEGPVAGGNYGWQLREGPCAKDSDTDCGSVAGMVDPVHWYHHGPFGAAATAAVFVPNGTWPAEYDGKFLFADYVFGQIYRLDPTPAAPCLNCLPPTSGFDQVTFGDFLEVVSLRFGPDGSLYYATRNGSEIRRITYNPGVNRTPTAVIGANPTYGPLPLQVQFDGSASSDPDGDALTYSWDFESDGVEDSTQPAPTHTYAAAGSVQATLTVSDGNGGADSAVIDLHPGNEAPTPSIDSPLVGTEFAVGDQFTLVGSATDPEDGSLPDSSLSWEVLRHHALHTHPFLEPTIGNTIPLTYPDPEDVDAAQDSYLEVRLTVTDSAGISQTISRNLMPKKVDLTFHTDPTGLTLSVGGNAIVGTAVVTSWEGYQVPVNAPDQSNADGGWTFSSWSDGGAQAHVIGTPAVPTSYTATFTPAQGETTFVAVADTYVDESKPNHSYGSRVEFRTDGSPVLNSYLRFSVQGLSDFSAARLRLYMRSGASQGVQVHAVTDNTWDEGTMTWSNAPGIDPAEIASDPAPSGTWLEIDVSSLVTDNGLVSFAITNANSTAVAIRARESQQAPELIVGSPQPPPPNQDPVATFTYSCTDLDCSFDASGSSDPDGTIVSYAWNYGGDGTGSGVTAQHTFSAGGDYAVVLTVTDDAGATAQDAQTVSVSGPPPPPPPGTTFVVTRNGGTYEAASSTHTFTGTLKSVVESAVALLGSGGGTIHFTAGDFDFGTDHFEFDNIANITFEGEGMGQTTIRNSTNEAADTEPFDVVGGFNLTVRDLTVSAGGAPRSTSDGLDFDNSSYIVIERVEVIGSRAKGIIFDGKGAGWAAEHNTVRECVITGVPGKGIELLASSNNLIDGCTITDVGDHGIQVNKSSTSAAQPNKQSSDNTITGNTIIRAGENGIFVNSGDRNVITGNTILNSSQLVSSRDGIRIDSADSVSCNDNGVDGNLATDDQATKTQAWGLNIASPLCNRTVVGATNIFAGNLVGEINDQGTDTIFPPPPDDSEPPTQPTGLQATAVSGCRVALSWDASSDNIGVEGYGIYRDGTLIGTTNGVTTDFADTGVSPGGTYAYRVDAFDLAGNRSPLSSEATATTPGAACSVTYVASEDSYVEAADPGKNNGTKTQVRADGSPVVVSYLKFNLPVGGAVSSATLRIYVNSNHSVGFNVRGVADSSWSETTITYANAPALGGVTGSSGPFAGGTWVEVDVTSIIGGGGDLSLALTTTSSTAMSLASRETGVNAPQLVIEAQ